MERDVLRRPVAWAGIAGMIVAGCLPAWPGGELPPGEDDLPQVVCDTQGVVLVGWQVVSDDNDDGIVNKGERVGLKVTVKNCDGSDRRGLAGELSTTDADVTVESYYRTTAFGDLARGDAVAGSSTLYFNVDAGAAPGSIPFVLDVTDTAGGSWRLAFEVPVQATGAGMAFVTYQVTADDNGDDRANPGERVGIRVTLHNGGTSGALGVHATLSTIDPDVTVETYYKDTEFGDVAAGDDATGASTLYFNVAKTAPVHNAHFALAVADADGNPWNLDFAVPIEATGASMAFVSYQVTADDNGDDQANRGERVGLRVTVRNGGTSKVLGVAGTLATTDADVTVETYYKDTEFGDVPAGDSALGASTMWFNVSKTAAAHVVPFSFDLLDTDGNAWKLGFDVPIVATGAAPVFESVQVTADDDGDRQAEKGERVGLRLTVRNGGTSKVLGLEGTVSTGDAAAAVETYYDSTTFGDVDAAQSVTGSATVYFKVSSTATAHSVPFTLDLADADGNTWQAAFQVPVK